jgi:probable DNA metabolism protein
MKLDHHPDRVTLMKEFIYLYDGSLTGFLCCIFESYSQHEILTAIYCDEDSAPVLFASRRILSKREQAIRVYQGIVHRSQTAASLLLNGFLSCMRDREMNLYRLVVKLFRDGPAFLNNLSDDTLYPVRKAVLSLQSEAEKYRGFIRFSDYNGMLVSEIEPKNRILPILRSHFCNRFQNETFCIYDRSHHEALFYTRGKSRIMEMDEFTTSVPDQNEIAYRLLWKRFYDTIAIQERFNPKCRMTQMPKRYWNTMTEFQDDSCFSAGSLPEDAPTPSFPAERPVPEKRPESAPSVPGSDP